MSTLGGIIETEECPSEMGVEPGNGVCQGGTARCGSGTYHDGEAALGGGSGTCRGGRANCRCNTGGGYGWGECAEFKPC
jgi:hypothetical protein